ncbi:hypothetical protein CBS147353_10529 [Aspergillus niger]|nr:hypothetical protein CBS147353_10529 [Aspergillus niger]
MVVLTDTMHSCPASPATLNEVAAPPVYDASQKFLRQNDCLENQQSDSASSGGVSSESDVMRIREPDYSQEKQTKPGRMSKFLQTTFIVSYLIVFSIIGTLLRLAIESPTFYPGTPVNTRVLWANFGGSMIMGFLSEDQKLFHLESVGSTVPGHVREDPLRRAAHLKAHKKTVPLFIGLTAGFCGSLTSFSTFMRDVFLAFSNDLAVPSDPYSQVSLFTSSSAELRAQNGGFSFMALVAVLFTEIGLSLAGFFLGTDIAIALGRWTPTLPQTWLRKYLNPLVVVLACLTWIIIICLVILLPQQQKTTMLWNSYIWQGPFLFSLVFAPVGCLARFCVSLKLNNRVAGFPLGTFVVNTGGTMLLGMAFTLQHAPVNPSRLDMGGLTGCEVLQGIMDGFCGCLTTVSTWVLELSDLRRQQAYVYGGVSVAVALCFLVVEIGSLRWTEGLATPACFAR